jgi:hypothetical protein
MTISKTVIPERRRAARESLKHLSEIEKADRKAEIQKASKERRRALAIDDLRRLREATDVLAAKGIAFRKVEWGQKMDEERKNVLTMEHASTRDRVWQRNREVIDDKNWTRVKVEIGNKNRTDVRSQIGEKKR